MPLILDSSPSPSPPPVDYDDKARLRIDHHSADAIVVGAGVVGTALAITLARQSRSVILLEHSLKEPDRIVGELLQPGGVEALEDLGLRDCLEDIDAIKVDGYEVIYHGQPVHIPYPQSSVRRKDRRPEGRSFHHGRFVRRLRERAMKTPNLTVLERTVTELVKWQDHVLGAKCVVPKTKQADCFFAPLTFVCDGYNSKFRREAGPDAMAPMARSKFWGLELHDMSLPRPQHGHVIIGSIAPILLYQIGSGETRALIDIPASARINAVSDVKAYLRGQVLPSLPEQVRPSFETAIDESKLRCMPNSWLPPQTQRTPGFILLGDAMNMRHPLTGGGMTVGLNDVVLLNELLSPEAVSDFSDSKLVLKQMGRFHWHRKMLSSTINILAQALYQLFSSGDDKQLSALQLGCFRYFQLGGNCIDGPVGLLAGIIRQPLVLFYHFFSVALLGMWIMLKDAPVYLLPLTLLRMVGVFWRACVVIGPFIISEMKS